MRQKKGVQDAIKTLLLDAGFSEKESLVYKTLLEKGTLSAIEVMKLTDLKKGITYTLLYKLVENELVLQFEKEGQLYFQPNDPDKLKNFIERKKKAVEDVASRIDKALPSLKSTYKLAVGKPTIQYFEGGEGIKAIFEDIYGKKEKGDIVYGCVDLEKADAVFPAYITSKLIPKRIRNKVFAHSFLGDSAQAREIVKNDSKQYRKSVLIDKNNYPLPAEIDVYENKIAMLSFAKGEFIGILIENPDLAQSLKSIFKLAFSKHAGD